MTAQPFTCTLTGVDDHTPLPELTALSRAHPFVEWGVLYSPGRAGAGRYPSLAWIARLAEALRGNAQRTGLPRFALHVCGKAVGEFLANGPVLQVAREFPRVQLNFKVTDIRLPDLRVALVQRPGQVIITQHNQTNAAVAPAMGPSANHALLFDASGGRGVLRGQWPAPLPGFACGYAGGIGPANVAEQLPLIHVAANGAPYWIDMESSLRNDADRFDLERARAVLEQVAGFRTASQPATVAV